MCYQCQNYEESVIHLFYDCVCAQDLWENFKLYIHDQYPDEIVNINAKNVIFNRVVERINSVINLLCLLLKQYMYKQKCLKKCYSWVEVKNLYKYTKNVEKYIAIKNNRLCTHYCKWRKNTKDSDASCISQNQHYVFQYLDKIE